MYLMCVGSDDAEFSEMGKDRDRDESEEVCV